MQQTAHTPDTLRTKLAAAIQRDIKTAKNYLKICRQYIQQADNSGDNETAVFWANQYDNAAQQVQALNYQLKTI
jgi:DNA-binding ferritin-like protein